MRTINEDASFTLDGFPFARARASGNLSFRDNDTSAGVHPPLEASPESSCVELTRVKASSSRGVHRACAVRSEGLILRDGSREPRSRRFTCSKLTRNRTQRRIRPPTNPSSR